MNFFKYELKEIKKDVAKLEQKVHDLEINLDIITQNYFVFLLHKNNYNKIEQNIKDESEENDLEWNLKFYNYE